MALLDAEDIVRRKVKDANSQVSKHLATARRCAAQLESYNDVYRVAHIRGRALLIEGEPQEALKVYNEALASNLPKDNSYVLLALERIDYLLTDACPPKLKRSPASLVKDADQVLPWATDPSLKAHALATAGLTRAAAANESDLAPEAKKQYQTDAIRLLREAIQTRPSHMHSWIWRMSLAKLLHVRMVTARDPKRRKDYHDEAEKHLNEALRSPHVPVDWTKTIQNMLIELNRRG
jgi:tetratricopeptide (TPR) repeat protein